MMIMTMTVYVQVGQVKDVLQKGVETGIVMHRYSVVSSIALSAFFNQFLFLSIVCTIIDKLHEMFTINRYARECNKYKLMIAFF